MYPGEEKQNDERGYRAQWKKTVDVWITMLYMEKISGCIFNTMKCEHLCSHKPSGLLFQGKHACVRGCWVRVCVREGATKHTIAHAPCPGVKWGKGSVDVSKPRSLPHSDSTVAYLFPDY